MYVSSNNDIQKVANMLYAEFTGQDMEQMEMETNRENFLSPKDAMELGLIDGII